MTTREPSLSPPALRIEPPLDPGDVVFLAGFTAAPVCDHEGRAMHRAGVARVWPGRPGGAAPWVPCADGCCLVSVPGGRAAAPGFAVEWLRFLLAEFLSARHVVSGQCPVPVLGGPSTLVLVEGGEVFEGVPDRAAESSW